MNQIHLAKKCTQPWTKNRVALSLEELVAALKTMIEEEKKLNTIPDKPPADFKLMQRRDVGTYGTPTYELKMLDEKRAKRFATVKDQARDRIAERHVKRKGSIYSQLQPIKTPSWDALVGERIDVLYDMEYDYPEGEDEECDVKRELRWCQGKVTKIQKVGDVSAVVEVEWDAMDEAIGNYEEKSVEDVELQVAKFNKDSDGGWRLDLQLAVLDVDFAESKVVMEGKKAKKKEEGPMGGDSEDELHVTK